MARLMRRRGELRDATIELLDKLMAEIEQKEKEVEALRREEKLLKAKLEEEE